LKALHWAAALLTTGESSLHAATVQEELGTVGAMLWGVVYQCWMYFLIVQTASTALKINEEKNRRLKLIRAFTTDMSLTPIAKGKLYRFMKGMDKKFASRWDCVPEVLEMIPPYLRDEVKPCIYRKALCTFPFFRSVPKRHLHECAQAAEILFYNAGDSVIKQRSIPRGMYFLLEGEVVLMPMIGEGDQDCQDEGEQTRILCAMHLNGVYPFFGDLFVFSPIPDPAPYRVIARTDVKALMMPRASLVTILQTHPDMQPLFVKFDHWYDQATVDDCGLTCCSCGKSGHYDERCTNAVSEANGSKSFAPSPANGKPGEFPLRPSLQLDVDDDKDILGNGRRLSTVSNGRRRSRRRSSTSSAGGVMKTSPGNSPAASNENEKTAEQTARARESVMTL
jgi:hypothetical protein